MLVQAHRAQRVDWQTHLLAETDQQPVDLTPQLPGQGEKNKSLTVEPVPTLCSVHFGAGILWRHKRTCFFSNTYLDRLQIKSTAVLCCSRCHRAADLGSHSSRALRVSSGFLAGFLSQPRRPEMRCTCVSTPAGRKGRSMCAVSRRTKSTHFRLPRPSLFVEGQTIGCREDLCQTETFNK